MTHTRKVKGKAEASMQHEPTEEEIMDEALEWAQAFPNFVENQFSAIGENMEEVDGHVGDPSERVNVMAGGHR